MPLPLYSTTEHPLKDLFDKYSKAEVKVIEPYNYKIVSPSDSTINALTEEIHRMGLSTFITPVPKGKGPTGDNIVHISVQEDAAGKYHVAAISPYSANLRGLS